MGIARGLMLASALGVMFTGGLQAQRLGISNDVVKIGILGDMSGVFQDLSGASSVVAARMAIDDSSRMKNLHSGSNWSYPIIRTSRISR